MPEQPIAAAAFARAASVGERGMIGPTLERSVQISLRSAGDLGLRSVRGPLALCSRRASLGARALQVRRCCRPQLGPP
eukprot:6760629-Alexandrium_andersonii.AAC.1